MFICISKMFLATIKLSPTEIEEISARSPGMGLCVSPLFSFGGGGFGGRDVDAVKASGSTAVLLVGMADRYDTAAKHGVTVREICVGGFAPALPTDHDEFNVLIDALVTLRRECGHPFATRIITAATSAMYPPDPPVPGRVTATLVNLTPHAVRLALPTHAIREEIFESRGVARAEEVVSDHGILATDPLGDGGYYQHVPLVRRGFGAVTGLPSPQPGLMFIVSQVVLDACPDRDDLVTPYPVTRDSHGRVTGCLGFARAAKAPSLPAGWEERAIERARSEGVLSGDTP